MLNLYSIYHWFGVQIKQKDISNLSCNIYRSNFHLLYFAGIECRYTLQDYTKEKSSNISFTILFPSKKYHNQIAILSPESFEYLYSWCDY